jgi:tetratricopeptide (TPR) repeat protein
LEIAERFEDLELHADALATLAAFNFDRPEEALQMLHRSIELAETNRFLHVAFRGHHNLGVTYSFYLSDSRSAIPHFLRALEIARERGSVDQEAAELNKLLSEQLNLGNILAAESNLLELDRIHQKIPENELLTNEILDAKAQISSMRGQLAAAFELYNQSLAEARRVHRVQHLYGTALFQYLPLLLDMNRYQDWADWGVAEDLLNEVLDLASHSSGIIGPGETEALMSVVCARQNRIEEAILWLDRAKSEILPDFHDLARSLVDGAEMELAVVERRWEEAIQKSELLLEWYTRIGLRWDQAHTLIEMAEIHSLRGQPEDRERALDLYNQAREIFAEIGATGYVDIIEGRLQLLN